MNPIAEILRARKRSQNMGCYHPWQPAFNTHPLAACLDNHEACIEVEAEEEDQDFAAMLNWTLNMARAINRYCDENMVKADEAAQYWLEWFTWRRERVADLTKVM